MVLLLKMIYKLYHDEINYYNDPRTKDLFLSNNVFILCALVTVYHKFVTSWGPRFMKDRGAYELRAVLTAYNLLQILLSLRMFYIGSTRFYIFGPYKFQCEPVDYSNSELGLLAAKEVHNYFLVKVLDLLDTVFFVLRKKQRQVTFLHLYHHILMILASWIAVRFIPGGHIVFVGCVNAFVHTFMYSYYLYALHRNSSQIWWKKYITLMQIVQFSFIVVQWGIMFIGPSCGFPKKLTYLFIPQNMFMLAMFSQFYYKTYIKNKNT